MDTSSTTIPAFSKLGSFKKAVKSLQKQVIVLSENFKNATANIAFTFIEQHA
jgi:hypothetical protein